VRCKSCSLYCWPKSLPKRTEVNRSTAPLAAFNHASIEDTKIALNQLLSQGHERIQPALAVGPFSLLVVIELQIYNDVLLLWGLPHIDGLRNAVQFDTLRVNERAWDPKHQTS